MVNVNFLHNILMTEASITFTMFLQGSARRQYIHTRNRYTNNKFLNIFIEKTTGFIDYCTSPYSQIPFYDLKNCAADPPCYWLSGIVQSPLLAVQIQKSYIVCYWLSGIVQSPLLAVQIQKSYIDCYWLSVSRTIT